jgi:hypothetical protein
MRFVSKKRSPKESEGVLKPTRHHFSGVHVDTGDCGDHYCPGHSNLFLKCSCGFTQRVVGSEHAEEVKREHRMAVVEYHLGLVFTEDDGD